MQTYLEFFLHDECLAKKLPHFHGRAEEGDLPLAKEKDLVKGMKDLTSWLMDGHHDSSAGACHLLKTLEDFQGRGGV